MEAINTRLGQLENIEQTLYSQRQAVMRHRLQEDDERETRRQKEDQTYLTALLDRDHEEDVSTNFLQDRKRWTKAGR